MDILLFCMAHSSRAAVICKKDNQRVQRISEKTSLTPFFHFLPFFCFVCSAHVFLFAERRLELEGRSILEASGTREIPYCGSLIGVCLCVKERCI